MKARIKDFGFDFAENKQTVTLILDGDFRRRHEEFKDIPIEFDPKPWRKKRSLNANAYCWELIGKLAEAMNLPSEEIYRNAVKAVGVYRDFPPLPVAEAKTLRTAWGNLGIGWQTDIVDYASGDLVIVRCYYGSSVYNVKQMKRLVDYIVSDCHALGIETKTPEELAIMTANWKGVKIDA